MKLASFLTIIFISFIVLTIIFARTRPEVGLVVYFRENALEEYKRVIIQEVKNDSVMIDSTWVSDDRIVYDVLFSRLWIKLDEVTQ